MSLEAELMRLEQLFEIEGLAAVLIELVKFDEDETMEIAVNE